MAVVLSAAVTAGTACSSSTGETGAGTTTPTSVVDVFPGNEWITADPADVGIDRVKIDELATFLGQQSNCMAVVKDGKLIGEGYWNDKTPDTDQEIFSATKSITSMLVGIAQAEGKLDVGEPASTYITEWRDTPSSEVTIRDLLANVSGRYYDVATDYGQMLRAPDKTGFAIGLSQQHAPDTTWEYNNSAIQTIEAVLERATGEDVAEFARTRLFEPLGMTSTIGHDGAGNTLTFMGAKASCRDLARFGYLLLKHGRWGEEQVVPAAYVAEATAPATDLNAAYGYLIWLNRPGTIKLPNGRNLEGPLWPGAPPDAFAALGFGGQVVLVVPSEGLVVTRETNPTGEVASQGNVVNEITRILIG
jgi:CubicO group peptidase (beta-lactamase class C family)